MSTQDEDELKEKLDSVFNKPAGDNAFYLRSELEPKISQLITSREQSIKKQAEKKGRIEENAWSRQQMIVAQALEAPNSGFGRMIKWSIDLFNKRKLELLHSTNNSLEVK